MHEIPSLSLTLHTPCQSHVAPSPDQVGSSAIAKKMKAATPHRHRERWYWHWHWWMGASWRDTLHPFSALVGVSVALEKAAMRWAARLMEEGAALVDGS